MDERGCILDANAAACHLLGRPHHSLIGKPFVMYVGHDLRPEYVALLRETRQHPTPGDLLRGHLTLPTHGSVEVDLVVAPLDRSTRMILLQPVQPNQPNQPNQLTEGHPDADASLEQERQHREMLVAVTEALRPRPLTVPGLDLAYDAHAPDRASSLGGDLCDWLELPTGALHLAVIDAEGQGALALGVALTVVSTLRTLAAMNCPIEEMIPRAEWLVAQQEPGFTAAVTVVRYEPDRGRLHISRGGDPPPLVLRAGGTVERVGDSARPLGFDGRERAHVTDLSLGAGDALVVYTDGLLVGHPVPADGIAALEQQLHALCQPGEWPVSAGDIAGRLMTEGSRGDDAMVAVLCRTTGPSLVASDTGSEVFRATLRPTVGSDLDEVRHLLRRWADQRPVSWKSMHDLLLVVTELGENATRAARSSVQIEVRRVDDALDIEVVDDGPGLQAHVLDDLAQGSSTGGYGLQIVALICTDLRIVPSASGTVVRGRLRADAGR